MRCFPLIAGAFLLCSLASVPALSQQMHCKPCWHNFGQVGIGDSISFSIQLSNTGSKTLRISSKSMSGSGFSFGEFSLPVNVAPGGMVSLPVNFQPPAPGYSKGLITLKSNSPNSPLLMFLSGYGTRASGAELKVSPSTLNFGNVTVGSSATQQAQLVASGGSVTISSDESTSSEFAIVGLTLPVTITAGKSLTITIQFTPNASGAANGKAEFVSNAVDSTTIEQLTGTGVSQQSHNVYLTWQPGDGNAVGYNIYRGSSQSGPFTEINTSLDSSTNYTDYTVASGKTYYYVVTEVNNEGEESGYSNVAKAVIPNS
jgi:Abnormal spindle-like microcephaly-assoc'd, ASPM-SPD-2-Hydin